MAQTGSMVSVWSHSASTSVLARVVGLREDGRVVVEYDHPQRGPVEKDLAIDKLRSLMRAQQGEETERRWSMLEQEERRQEAAYKAYRRAQQEQDAKNRVADLNAESCDWDQTACVEQVLPNFVTQDCRTCALHVGNCMMTTHLTGENAMKSMTIDDCMDEIAERAEKECGECKSQASHQSYKVRMGLADPP